jgi:hypothetical protein
VANGDDAHLLEVVGGQRRQNLDIDGILAKCRLVLLKTKRSRGPSASRVGFSPDLVARSSAVWLDVLWKSQQSRLHR